MTADWQVFPSSQWNYSLAVNEKTIGEAPVTERPVGPSPFSIKGSAGDVAGGGASTAVVASD